ncbi:MULTISPECIES: arabinofuranosyltransferase [Actinomadura]|uniref:Arabinofuranosyltransferase A C terminal n=1 Tax=Actinomadura madurae TaxID=1993 RepID=A0A1I5DBU1_9ACTN|nr:arabinofuranosyltransferase [Actinomadura madurae]SFN96587.1 Arabinofuranosyltransferase A C terminal [Actinomadura madurae]
MPHEQAVDRTEERTGGGRPADDTPRSERALRRLLRNPGSVALVTWLVSLPVAFSAPSLLDLSPFTPEGFRLPLQVAAVAALLLGGVALRSRGPAVVGAAAGVLASFMALVIRTALAGTPFGYGGVHGDTGRITAMAVQYTRSWTTDDGIVGAPSEYPPLLPFVVGKVAALVDTPAWRLLGTAEALLVSASVVAGFALWCRLTTPVPALMISVAQLLVFGVPSKPHEVLALAVFVPLVLSVLARPPRGRLPWLAAGLITGAVCLTYHAWVVFSVPGLLVLGWWTWRKEPDRSAYLGYLARITAVVAVVTAWYTVPYVGAMLAGGQQVGDTFDSKRISEQPFPFLSLHPVALAELAGLVGLLRYVRRQWWAPPLLAVIGGCYVYRAVNMVRWSATGHSGLFYYTLPLIEISLLAGATLSAATAMPHVTGWLSRRMRRPFVTGAGVLGTTALVGLTAAGYATSWMPRMSDGAPATDRSGPALAALAHYQRSPDGGLPQSSPETGDPVRLARAVGITDWDYLPVAEIERLVRSTRPGDRRPRVLSHDEQVFAFLPWRGFIGVDRSGAQGPTRYDDRYAELERLALITDPAAFAEATRHTRFGSIDVFVLRGRGGQLVWKGLRVTGTILFRPAQFDPAAFRVASPAPGVFVAVRRP